MLRGTFRLCVVDREDQVQAPGDGLDALKELQRRAVVVETADGAVVIVVVVVEVVMVAVVVMVVVAVVVVAVVVMAVMVVVLED